MSELEGKRGWEGLSGQPGQDSSPQATWQDPTRLPDSRACCLPAGCGGLGVPATPGKETEREGRQAESSLDSGKVGEAGWPQEKRSELQEAELWKTSVVISKLPGGAKRPGEKPVQGRG